jgi:hypothetical protein
MTLSSSFLVRLHSIGSEEGHFAGMEKVMLVSLEVSEIIIF